MLMYLTLSRVLSVDTDYVIFCSDYWCESCMTICLERLRWLFLTHKHISTYNSHTVIVGWPLLNLG